MSCFLIYCVIAIVITAVVIPANKGKYRGYTVTDTRLLAGLYGLFWPITVPVHLLCWVIIYLADNKQHLWNAIKKLGEKDEN